MDGKLNELLQAKSPAQKDSECSMCFTIPKTFQGVICFNNAQTYIV